MYRLTDRNEHIGPRYSNDLKLLVKTILIDNEREVIEHIDRGMKDEPNASIEVPYVGTLTVGEIAVNWAKQNGKWDELVLNIAEGMAEEMLDAFTDCWMNGEEEILYLGSYAINHSRLNNF